MNLRKNVINPNKFPKGKLIQIILSHQIIEASIYQHRKRYFNLQINENAQRKFLTCELSILPLTENSY